MAKVVLSPRFRLVNEDISKILSGALVATIGAILTYITEQIPNIDLGEFTPVVVAMWSIMVNIVRKFLAENTYRITDK